MLWKREIKNQAQGVLLFARYDGVDFSPVAINFGDEGRAVPFWFPMGGDSVEQLHDNAEDRLPAVAPLIEQWLTIPGNYGRVWSRR